ncbi:MAG: PilZ domain-containing protein [Candidatus Omnitrophica bacterium]|nr:PilZ domain-containing protein [Candidatus Omnitrophota bacterium]
MRGQIRRRFIRWRVGHEIKLSVEDSPVPVSCQLDDISLKGIRLSLGIELKENRAVRLRFEFSEEFILDVEAWVAWHKMEGGFHSYGLYFTRVTDQQKEKIYQFIRRYFSEEITRRWHDETQEEEKDITMEDRRVFERFPANISLRYINLDSRNEGEAQTQDVSAKGLRLATNQELNPNTALELFLEVPDRAEPFYTRGEVAWSEMTGPDTFRAGVNLERIDFMGISRLLKL